jgi:hypothetical protein
MWPAAKYAARVHTRLARALVGAFMLAWTMGCALGGFETSSSADQELTAVDWPRSLPDDESMLDGLPEQIGGLERLEPEDGDVAVTDAFEILRVRYEGDGEDATLGMANLREPGQPPRLALVTMFFNISDLGDALRCAEGTYRGSLDVAVDEDGEFPGFTEEQIPETGLAWFSCLVPSTHEDLPSRILTGWFSGELVWMVDGSSPAVVQDLMNELATNADGHATEV